MTRYMLPATPLRDVLDDEEVLAGAHIAERPRRGRERSIRGRVPEALLERGLLPLQLSHGRQLHRALRAGIEVVVQRAVVEKPDEHEHGYRQPATGDGSAETPAACSSRSHPAGVLRRFPRSCG